MSKNLSGEAGAFGALVRDVARLIRRRFEKKAGDTGLTEAQWRVLAQLAQQEGIAQARLAELLDIEPITLVALLDKLEAAGYVERRLLASDRRVRLLYLTRQVFPLLSKLEGIKGQLKREAFAGVSAQDQKQIMCILQKIKSNLVGHDLLHKPHGRLTSE